MPPPGKKMGWDERTRESTTECATELETLGGDVLREWPSEEALHLPWKKSGWQRSGCPAWEPGSVSDLESERWGEWKSHAAETKDSSGGNRLTSSGRHDGRTEAALLTAAVPVCRSSWSEQRASAGFRTGRIMPFQTYFNALSSWMLLCGTV